MKIDVTITKEIDIDFKRLFMDGDLDLELPHSHYDVFEHICVNLDYFLEKQINLSNCEISEEVEDYLLDEFEKYVNALPSK